MAIHNIASLQLHRNRIIRLLHRFVTFATNFKKQSVGGTFQR